MSTKIEIYTKMYCAYCQRAKELLRIKGVNFIEHDITDVCRETAEISRGSRERTLPEIFVNDMHIGSCAELFELDERGELDELLGLAVNPGGFAP